MKYFHLWILIMGVIALVTGCNSDSDSSTTLAKGSGQVSTDPSQSTTDPQKTGTVAEQNQFVYQTMQEFYLWYDQIPQVDYAAYSSPEALLEKIRYAQLDKWSFMMSLDSYYSLTEEGQYRGSGFALKRDNDGQARIAFVYRDSPAYLAKLTRGDKILTVNGKTVQEITDNDTWTAELSAVSVTFTVEKVGGEIQEVVIHNTVVTVNTVLENKIVETNGVKIGYLAFESFIRKSYEELRPVFIAFKEEKIDELVVDLRYNGGGLLNHADYLASFIAGSQVVGKVFEELSFNDKHKELNYTTRFIYLGGETLNLPRVFIITTQDTCSASESVINGLRPFIEVIVIGDTTCGKPVGMIPFNFYDKVLLPIMFAGKNSLGEGDYFDGIAPTCYAPDDLTKPFADLEESAFKETVYYIFNNHCSNQGTTRSKHLSSPLQDIPLEGLHREVGAF